jgi:hypothetical protein
MTLPRAMSASRTVHLGQPEVGVCITEKPGEKPTQLCPSAAPAGENLEQEVQMIRANHPARFDTFVCKEYQGFQLGSQL